jgi:glycosyltransferase involved in cell wall biosynthesis
MPLGITHGLNCLVGESDEEIANHILYLLDNPIQAERLGSEGRGYATAQFDWNRTVEVLEEECFLSSGD